MNFETIGSIHSFVKNNALQSHWELKKKSGDIFSHKKLDEYLSTNAHRASANTLETKDAETQELERIDAKIKSGSKLTQKEKEFLKEKNPALYEKVRKVEEEEKAYEEALRRCKSKDEVSRMHVTKLAQIAEDAKNGDTMALYRANRMSEVLSSFTKSKTYKKLPTEAEIAIEREQERQERVEELREQQQEAKQAQEAALESDNQADKNGDSTQNAEHAERSDGVCDAQHAEHVDGAQHAQREGDMQVPGTKSHEASRDSTHAQSEPSPAAARLQKAIHAYQSAADTAQAPDTHSESAKQNRRKLRARA